MIRLVLLSLLVPNSALVVLAQNPDSDSVSTLSSITCKVETVPPPTTMHKWVAVSPGVMAERRTGGKNPKYPSDAKGAHVEGRVVIVATVSASGVVEDLCVSQGPEMLRQAAFDAVKTWKYKPIEVKGQAVEVKTQMNVDFELH
jgi:TonB family protein